MSVETIAALPRQPSNFTSPRWGEVDVERSEGGG
jgi:hypothetical protein